MRTGTAFTYLTPYVRVQQPGTILVLVLVPPCSHYTLGNANFFLIVAWGVSWARARVFIGLPGIYQSPKTLNYINIYNSSSSRISDFSSLF